MIATPYDDIRTGDFVSLTDQLGNHATGRVEVGQFQMTAEIFGTKVPFAQRNKADTWTPRGNNKLVAVQTTISAEW